MSLNAWINAARLRTLPLSAAGSLCGCLLAAMQQKLHWPTALLTVATAVSLQIFSNFANDYGDAQNGADSAGRQGPPRMVASGQISPETMRTGLKISAVACCLLGLTLLYTALPILTQTAWTDWLLWLLLGAAALAAAYGYTAGRRPYGYIGFGDAAVFVFFGLLAVLGSEYLHTGRLNPSSWLPAAAIGLWCTMVLNLNNMRDIDHDWANGKRTLAARLGLRRAKYYHAALALTAAACWSAWLAVGFHGAARLFLQVFMLAATFVHLNFLNNTPSSSKLDKLDKLLPQWSLTVSAWVVLLWLFI
ncbi:1,4-dihydroxy-2-naphthoate octaprenyltransferase [Neisseria sp. CCUG12390]|uniref:1,4-dihydroxy-2-naphthoate octaprenyltransferase n=1 Tax=Neisseria sp. CCUG12390 TaxID=3392035 RepID=UPI003A0FD590